jgi:hypothetical protein
MTQTCPSDVQPPAKACFFAEAGTAGIIPTAMRKIPREAITHIRIGNQCNTNHAYIEDADILEYERNRIEKCITDFAKRYIRIEQREIEPCTYETIGTLIVIDQDKIKDNEQEEETDNA